MTILIAVLGGVAVSGGSAWLSGVILALVTSPDGLYWVQHASGPFHFSGSNFFRDFAWGVLLLFVLAFTHSIKRSKTY
jgi:ribose/xylose/arabinose/galactoside ABC-type transport system permease subunit